MVGSILDGKEHLMPLEPNSHIREFLKDQAQIDENRSTATEANDRSISNEFLLTGAGGIDAVTITELSDFPTPSGGDITLVEDTLYYILGEVDIGSNRIILGANTPIEGRQPRIDSIISSNATEVIRHDRLTGQGPLIARLSIIQNGSGDAVYLNAALTMNAVINSLRLQGDLIVEDLGGLQLSLCTVITGSRIAFTGTIGAAIMSLTGFLGSSGVNSVDITSTAIVSNIIIRDSQFITVTGSTGVFQDGSAIVSQGDLTDLSFLGAGTFISGFSKATNEWCLFSNSGLSDSRDRGIAKWFGSGVTIDLPTAAAWTDISDAGVTISYTDGANEKFSISDPDTGEMMYNGVNDKANTTSASVTFTRTSGSSFEVEFALAVNSVIQQETIVAGMAAISPSSVLIPSVVIDLAPSDVVRLRVRNVDSSFPAADIDVTSVQLTIFS